MLEYKKENESLKNLSITDDLTSIYNHRYFYECFDDRIGRGCKQLTLFFCDIDHFKMINDLNGHIVGDLVLREIAVILKESVGAAGDVFRYGGEEFVILVDNLRSEEAFKLAETVRLKVANSKILEQKSGYFPVTISIGIARYLIDAMNGEALVKSADMAMYYAKQNGRNQCQVYDSELPEKLAKQSLEFSKQEMLLESAYTLAAIIDAKDKYTEKHSESVIKFSLRLAEKLRMSDKDKYVLKIGALLHDIGKIGIADDVLHKDGPLSEHEWKIVKNHPVMGSNIIKHIIKTPDIETCIRYHHERWDGKGYPEGLTGQAIPIYARIICLADAFHAMISDRPYRTALSQEEAFNQLRKNMGIQFDPDLVEPFIAAVREPSGDVFAEPCANTI